MINDKGGVNGRKITLITPDDAYSPPKTMGQEEVAAILKAWMLGTSNAKRRFALLPGDDDRKLTA